MSSLPSPDLLPKLVTPVPGPASRSLAERLGRVESPNVTFFGDPPPIFWQRATGSLVWDADGNRFLDLTAAFGVANAGHAHPEVTNAVARQAETLLHGMGDVHPSSVKVALLEALVARFPGGGEARGILGSSGSDAVESAIKTAQIATGRPGILAFEGGYHGLALGALDTTHRQDFREPFAARLPGATRFARFGDLDDVARHLDEADGQLPGAILVEPVQGRGGERVAPRGFLPGLRALCDARGLLLIADEVYTGFGRTGRWFACDHEQVIPDLICMGKGLASGMPISACLGGRAVMDAWPVSSGEALHTQTFLGHPASCAAALASMEVIEREGLVERAERLGAHALKRLSDALGGDPEIEAVRGLGLMLGVEFRAGAACASVVADLLQQGILALPSGAGGCVLSLTPPLSIEPAVLDFALDRVIDCSSKARRTGPAGEASPV
ncbi:MAG: aspartate aminotransferase family protein [Myxococcota bacterium]|nr:aspartate aminotransferase family protein [Myxococcota bacterium]